MIDLEEIGKIFLGPLKLIYALKMLMKLIVIPGDQLA